MHATQRSRLDACICIGLRWRPAGAQARLCALRCAHQLCSQHGLLLPGCHSACIAGGVQRSLAIEMKQLLTDAGRLKFLDTVR